MANINDSSSIFVGATLDLFTAVEAAVARDGDVAYAQQVMQEAMRRVLTTTGPTTAGSGQTVTRRKS